MFKYVDLPPDCPTDSEEELDYYPQEEEMFADDTDNDSS